jgi:hypothetical protein
MLDYTVRHGTNEYMDTPNVALQNQQLLDADPTNSNWHICPHNHRAVYTGPLSCSNIVRIRV